MDWQSGLQALLEDEDWQAKAGKLALAAAEVGVWTWHAETGIVRWSETQESLYGLPPGTFPGTYEAYKNLLHPEDRHHVEQIISRAMETGTKFRMEHRAVLPDGTVRWIEGRGEPYRDENGNITGMLGTSSEVTDRKDAETQMLARIEQQAALAELSHLALGETDLQSLLERTAQRISRVFGVEHCHIVELLPGQREVLLRAGVGWQQAGNGQVESIDEGGLMAYVLRQQQPVIVHDLMTDSRFQASRLLSKQGVVSGISTVIKYRGDCFGILGVYSKRHRPFSEDDSHFLRSLANILAMAIERHDREGTIRELSTPVLEIALGALLVPVVGHLDVQRAGQLEDNLLHAIHKRRVRMVVIDLTGASNFDVQVAHRFIRTVAAAQLLGAKVLVSGISTSLAETLIALGPEVRRLNAVGDLRSAIEAAVHEVGLTFGSGPDRA